MRPGSSMCAVLLLMTWLPGLCVMAEPGRGPFSEDQVKAAFLMRFPGYVEWPPTFAEGAPFAIAIMGDDGVADELRALLPSRQVKGRRVIIRHIDHPSDAADTQMLFIGREAAGQLAAAVAALANKPVLIVTDAPAGLGQGAMVNFLRVERRVQFELSLAATESAGLTVMPELLSVARRVIPRNSRSEAACARMPAGLRHLHGECRESLWFVGSGTTVPSLVSTDNGSLSFH